MSEIEQKPTVGVQQQILDKFLNGLQEGGISASVVERLRVAVASEEVSEVELKKALFSDDTQV